MKLKKVRFPFLVFALAIGLIFYSCTTDKKEDKEGSANYITFMDLAKDLYKKNQLDSAYHYYSKAYSECKEDEKDNKIIALIYMMFIEQAKGDYSASEERATEALKIDSKNKNLSCIYNGLGLSYLEQKDFETSIKYFNNCLQISQSKIDESIVRSNIGYAYMELHQFKKAESVFKKLVVHDTVIAEKETYARVLDNLGFTYFKMNNPIAIDYLNKSFKIRDSIKDNFGIIASYMHLSEYYQKKDVDKSNQFAHKAYNVASKIKSLDDRLEAMKFMIENPKLTIPQIKDLCRKRMELSDSIVDVRQATRSKFAKYRYDATLAIKESEKQKSQKLLYMTLFVLVSLASSVLFFFIRNLNRKKLQKVTYETETRISKKLHDELANDVFNAMTFADTQNLDDPNKREVLVDNLDKIYTQARNISKENSEIDTGENFEPVLKTMLSSYSNSEVSVIISQIDSVDWLKMKKDSKIVIYRALQELMVNMKKHSHSSHVFIRFESHNNNIEINYSDNGVGCDEMLNLKKGLQNAENRISAIKGSINFETATGKGFKARMIIPK